MDDRMKKRIKELGEAINQSLSDSDPIAAAIGKIKAEGYDIFLVLEATIGFTRQDQEQEEETREKAPVASSSALSGAAPALNVTAQDLKFLKSMRIGIEES